MKPISVIRKLATLIGNKGIVCGGCCRDIYLGRIPKDYDIFVYSEKDLNRFAKQLNSRCGYDKNGNIIHTADFGGHKVQLIHCDRVGKTPLGVVSSFPFTINQFWCDKNGINYTQAAKRAIANKEISFNKTGHISGLERNKTIRTFLVIRASYLANKLGYTVVPKGIDDLYKKYPDKFILGPRLANLAIDLHSKGYINEATRVAHLVKKAAERQLEFPFMENLPQEELEQSEFPFMEYLPERRSPTRKREFKKLPFKERAKKPKDRKKNWLAMRPSQKEKEHRRFLAKLRQKRDYVIQQVKAQGKHPKSQALLDNLNQALDHYKNYHRWEEEKIKSFSRKTKPGVVAPEFHRMPSVGPSEDILYAQVKRFKYKDDTDFKKMDEYLMWEDPKKAEKLRQNIIGNLDREWEDYWQQAQQGPQAAGGSDKQAAYENWLGTRKNLEGTDLEMSLRKRIFGKEATKTTNPMDLQPGEDTTDWFQRIMQGSIKLANVSELLKDPSLRKKLKKDLEHTMKKDKGPDSLDEAYNKLDDQIEEQMDDIVPPGKPDKTGKG